MGNNLLTYSIKDNESYNTVTVFTDGKVFCELDCLKDFISFEEEIQNYLDDNGYGDESFNFQLINKTLTQKIW